MADWRAGCYDWQSRIPEDFPRPTRATSITMSPSRSTQRGTSATANPVRWPHGSGRSTCHPGNRVYHLGCGVGYFTAIMSEVVGVAGHVIASEVDAGLAERARQNLVGYSNVEVHAADGAALDPGVCDAIFINAGVTHPHLQWLERLAEGGRMILPLTIPMGATLGKGVMARIVRKGAGYSARMVGFVAIYSCTSARDLELEPILGRAMTTGALFKMRSVRRDAHEPTETCIVHGLVCISAAGPVRLEGQ